MKVTGSSTNLPKGQMAEAKEGGQIPVPKAGRSLGY